MTPEDAKLILTYADSNMNASATGRRIYMSSSAISNHFDKIELETGKDPRCFWELVQLAEVAWFTLQMEKGQITHA